MAIPQELLGPRGPRALLSEHEPTHWPIIDDDCRKAVMSVLDRGILSGPFAPEAQAFQEEFAEFVGAKHALMTHSGTSALIVALAAAGVEPGDEVLVPSYTFVATPLSVVSCGGVPVFVDVDPQTGCMTPSEARKWISDRTKAIMPVHVHGCPADLSGLATVARECGAKLVEDAAQAHGATYQERPVGALYDGGAFSLQSSKNLGCGEGGVYVTNHPEQAELANQVRNFGQDLSLSESARVDLSRPLDGWRSMESRRPGSMYRGNELTAAFARAQLRRLPERTAACQENAARLSQKLASLPGVQPPYVPAGCRSVHHKYRIAFDLQAAGLSEFSPAYVRAALVSAMKACGFEVTLWERTPQPAQKVFRDAMDVEPRVRDNYQAAFPVTQGLLDSSLVLFTQTCPLIAQSSALVDAYFEAFASLWEHRHAIVTGYEP